MGNRQIIICFAYCLALFSALSFSQDFKKTTDGFFVVETASKTDEYYLPQLFLILQNAKKDLRNNWGFGLPSGIVIKVHPNLSSFISTTKMPWYVAGLANQKENTIDVQRLRVLIERNSLEATFRHELFHLAQPNDWPRWQAEGSAMLFAKERPQAEALLDISEQDLNNLLSNAKSRESLQIANATALSWVEKLTQ